MDGAFDVPAKKVFPEKVVANTKALNQALAGRNPVTHPFIPAPTACGEHAAGAWQITLKGALGQATADQAALACALERYRLAHGQFPDKLEALAPDFISALPHDVITGGPYNYQRSADSLVLYSVGWNETDDGGKVVMTGRNGDPTEGDWVLAVSDQVKLGRFADPGFRQAA